jgi:isopentenyldiphosphate isomerase
MHRKCIAVVDDDDNVIGKATWEEAHEKGMITRAANVLVFNSKGELFVHKRSGKLPTFPGMYDVKAGGIVDAGESYDETALRELKEEVGIESAELELLFFLKYRTPEHKNNRKIYQIVYDGELKLQEEEIESGKFMTIEEVKNLFSEGKVSASGQRVWEEFLKWKQGGKM